jgi:serine/threonine-protein kinase
VIPDIEPTERPADYLHRIGTVFEQFGGDTQDSGNISYGVRLGDSRYFVKTAGDPAHTTPALTHQERVALLRTAVRLASTIEHSTLPKYHGTIESVEGPLLFYSWNDGEHLRTHHSARNDPATAFQRFRALPDTEILRALDLIYDLHGQLTRVGWVAGDFYDGALMYDFKTSRLTVMDLDSYQLGAYRNNMGRMFGSSRFMAPEEYQLGALINQRTTLFVMARTALVLLSDGTVDRAPFRGTDAQYAVLRRATSPTPSDRHPTYSSFHHAWLAAGRFR